MGPMSQADYDEMVHKYLTEIQEACAAVLAHPELQEFHESHAAHAEDLQEHIDRVAAQIASRKDGV